MASGAVSVVGLQGGEWFGGNAARAVREADVVIGSTRHLDALGPEPGAERISYRSVATLVDLVSEHLARGTKVCVLASGDPGFFGAVRILVGRFGPTVAVHPAPSSVSLAFARIGMAWDDAVVVSAHGRPLDSALAELTAAPKAAVLTSPDAPPQAVGRALAHAGHRDIWVCTHLGERDETVVRTDVAGLSAGRFDPLSVVVVARTGHGPSEPTVAWRGFGRPVAAFAHRAGLITKPEVRAVVLGKLELHAGVTLWDVGAGSGSVSVEAARLAPGLRAWAVERHPDDCRRIAANADGLAVSVVAGEAPDKLLELPTPDRAFVGGGGLDVLETVCGRVAPGGVVVATFTTIDRAGAAAARLGNLVQISVNRAEPIGPDGALRLAADNPVFVAWGRPQ